MIFFMNSSTLLFSTRFFKQSFCIWRTHAILFLLLILSFLMNSYNNHFPLGFHADEPKKISFLLENTQDFMHPILMLQLTRIVNLVFHFKTPESLIILGRSISAIFGTLTVFLIYHIAKKAFKQESYALITAFVCAVSPILVIHAHYYKEGIYFTAFALFFIYQLFNFKEKKSFLNALLLSIVLGLAFSAEYIGILLVLLLPVVPLLDSESNTIPYYLKSVGISCFALAIFALVNYPLLTHYGSFENGLKFELLHAKRGHDIIIYPWSHYFCFHLLHSIIPGITISLTLLGCFGLILTIINWKTQIFVVKLLCLYVLVNYLIFESSPLKPYPDFMRYMLSLSPVFILFTVLVFKETHQYLSIKYSNNEIVGKLATILFLILSCGIPFYKTLQLDYYLPKDTRVETTEWFNNTSDKIAVSGTVFYTFVNNKTKTMPLMFSFNDLNTIKKAKENHIHYLIFSSFFYQRYLDTLNEPDKTSQNYILGNWYQFIFKHYAYIEIKPKYESFAFSNPTIRIVDLEHFK